ncbi:hypothetical protein BT63DRAFT_395024 [Microthyrium microscopicum]|uniref:Uncharacterized protein n=1 Tax=Microthyrium microscopicum TaxID=703497 RepID=A0A6A6USV4_9PEZI|nr:hypothetical protein BT63DRAFT_395024 [Microthyrium microscopicum]
MTSKTEEPHRASEERSLDQDFLSPQLATSPGVDEVSDVESFTRTREDVDDVDDDEELEMAESGIDLPTPGYQTPPQVEIDDDGSTIRTPERVIEPDISVQGSLASSPGSARISSQNSTLRNTRRGSLQPFDRRFSGMFLTLPRVSSPSSGYRPGHSRQSSMASTIIPNQEADTPQPPWEVVRWSKLKKITGSVFSEMGKRNYGRPTGVAIGASIIIGTSKGLALVFDYHQNLTATIGLGTKAVECGAVTALAISADHTTIAVGHITGHIFTWEIARPAKPFLHVFPLPAEQVEDRRSDGHVTGSAVVHVGFLGTRHTALVSADNHGMAFSHLATRGLGSVARAVKTARVLGRYPPPTKSKEKPKRASSVLAFSPLPLGNIEHLTDGLGLTAMLTPYLLVVVSTTPIAETQFKAPRPKEIAPHSTLSGCLAWFPAVKLRRPDPDTGEEVSKTKLVYCWSNVLTILDVEAQKIEEKERPPVLHFRPRSRWRSEEAIVAVQWLSRSVLGILTISQRLIILEDKSLQVTDSFDLIQKHIFHQDIFSSQLKTAVESLDEGDESMHGVVADAFFMSFRAYKGRLFLLGFNDISIGTLSNWADRLVALLEGGEYIEAIRLAEAYYSGATDRITVGLPEDDDARHAMVQEKIIEIMTASLKYVFQTTNGTTNGEHSPQTRDELIQDLASATISSCLAIQDMDFLFEDVYDPFQEAGLESIFFNTLEPYILSQQVTAVPTEVFKSFVAQYNTDERAQQLENVICHLDVRLMDIDQTATICKRYQLYDALIYVWNQSIGEYVTPLIELLGLVKTILASEAEPSDNTFASAGKLFPYLAHTFTGKSYPSGNEMDEADAFRAKADVYGYIFSGKSTAWPPGSKTIFHTTDQLEEEPDYPYLTLILQFNAASFLSVLNEAFEDHFLNGANRDENGDVGPTTNGARDVRRLLTRQSILSILLDVMGDENFESDESIYLDMFIARNLPKFPQFIVLPGNILEKVLQRLCDYPSDELADDCQLSVEYLLSYYHPSDIARSTPMFREAGFFRVLKTIYRGAKLYAQLLQTCFEDLGDREAVFDCIGDCLRSGSDLNPKQIREVQAVILKNAQDLVSINNERAAQTVLACCPDLLEPILEALDEDSYARFMFLKNLLEKSDLSDSPWEEKLHKQFGEEYVRLMCTYEPSRVASYIDVLKTSDLRLSEVLPAIESSGAIDAAVVLLTRDGLVKDAMDRLKKHIQTLGSALAGLMNAVSQSPDVSNITEGVEDLLSDVQKYSKVGIWLCQGQTKAAQKERETKGKSTPKTLKKVVRESDLDLDELLWLDLVDTIVNLSKDISALSADLVTPDEFEATRSSITSSIRAAVQECFTALLTSTARPTLPSEDVVAPSKQPHPSFLVILRAFLTRAATSSPSLSDLRAVLGEIFQAYAYEERILNLANQFLDKDVFTHVDDAWLRRQKGWRPRGNTCEFCNKRVWGPGVGGAVWDQWQANVGRRDQARQLQRTLSTVSEASGRGKGKEATTPQLEEADVNPLSPDTEEEDGEGEQVPEKPDKPRPLVVFACRHVWHRDCLELTLEASQPAAGQARHDLRCPAAHHSEI